MFEVALALTIFLLALTIIFSFLIYRKLRYVKEEYINAKNVIEDIIVSFNRQLDRQNERFESITSKLDSTHFKVESLERKLEEYDGKFKKVEEEVSNLVGIKDEVSTRLDGFEKKLGDLEVQQKKFEETLSEFESLEVSNPRVEYEEAEDVAPIPIRREKVLSRLTDTEISVLEILANEGAKTAPEIKDRIKLTREHTARLMKKLYEQGYLERDTSKIPYSYRVKEEMLRFLKKKRA